jgi:hypothetical protein
VGCRQHITTQAALFSEVGNNISHLDAGIIAACRRRLSRASDKGSGACGSVAVSEAPYKSVNGQVAQSDGLDLSPCAAIFTSCSRW